MYVCLKNNQVSDVNGYHLAPIEQAQMEAIRQWRNAQISVLRQKTPISSDEQISYFQNHLLPLFTQAQPKQILFSYFFKDECIGYGGLTNVDFDSRRAEVSFLSNPNRTVVDSVYAQDFSHFLQLLKKVAFDDLHLHRLYTETYAFRLKHIQLLEQEGFTKEGVLKEHNYINQQWCDSILHGQLNSEKAMHEK